MRIKMAGIDYKKASVDVRELFSMTSAFLEQALIDFKETEGVEGCVIISTCNRTEIWISGETREFDRLNPAKMLCDQKDLPFEEYKEYFQIRVGEETVHYLMEMGAGIHSQIFGDDQIITQIKTAADRAREAGSLDTVLEILFRMSITGAKKVKSNVLMQNMDRSVAAAMTTLLREQNIPVEGKKCMVIGNGEIGRLAASELVKAGGDVCMTLRQYKKKEAVIPQGCQVILYDTRYERLPEMDIIVSATVSPHYTILKENVVCPMDGKVLIDLAIPRDIDPVYKDDDKVTFFDMDSFSSMKRRSDERQIREADEILKKYETEFCQWYEFRDYVPMVKEIAANAGQDASARLTKELKQYPLSKEEREELKTAAAGAAERAVAKLCYGLRENLDPELWGACLDALRRSAGEDS